MGFKKPDTRNPAASEIFEVERRLGPGQLARAIRPNSVIDHEMT
jgi:hypothetical protein